MAKTGSPKNTKNKALHSKLMDQKKNKQKKDKLKNVDRIKEMNRKFQESLQIKNNENQGS